MARPKVRIEIPLLRQGGHWYVRATLLWRDALLLIDTGASKTVVWTEWVKRNAVTLPKKRRITSNFAVPGQKETVALPSFRRIQVRLGPEKHLLVVSVETGGPMAIECDGLLAADFLKFYKFWGISPRGFKLILER